MALDMSSFNAALKQLYSDQVVQNLVYSDNPFLAMVKKDEQFYGANFPQPLIYANPTGRSASFANAQANVTSSKLKSFILTRVQDYAVATISNEVLLASQSDKGAFIQAAKTEIDGALNAVSRSLASGLYRSGTGSLASASAISSAVITLTNPDDVVGFEVGMICQMAATDGGTPRTGTIQLVGVDRNAGTITASAAVTSGISAAVAGDFILVQGDSNAKVSGLAAWLPFGGVTSTPFFGVDRTADSIRLGGVWQDGSAKPTEEALIDGVVRIAREGGKPDMAFMSYGDFGKLEKALGAKIQYVDLKQGDVGFRGIMLSSPTGMIKVIPDLNCPTGYCYILQMNTWCLRSLGKAPGLFDTDGQNMLRSSGADSVDVRITAYVQLACNAPGFNGVIKLPA